MTVYLDFHYIKFIFIKIRSTEEMHVSDCIYQRSASTRKQALHNATYIHTHRHTHTSSRAISNINLNSACVHHDAAAFNRLMYATVANASAIVCVCVCINRPLKTIYSLFYRFSANFFRAMYCWFVGSLYRCPPFALVRTDFSSLIVCVCMGRFFCHLVLFVPQQYRCGGVITALVCHCRLNLKMHVIFYCQTALLWTI